MPDRTYSFGTETGLAEHEATTAAANFCIEELVNSKLGQITRASDGKIFNIQITASLVDASLVDDDRAREKAGSTLIPGTNPPQRRTPDGRTVSDGIAIELARESAAARQLYVVIDGGLVSSICSPTPDALADLDVTVIDYDTDGAETEDLGKVKQDDGRLADAFVSEHAIERATIEPVG